MGTKWGKGGMQGNGPEKSASKKAAPKLKKGEVLYRVTGDFGDSPRGEIRKAVMILKNGGSALLYHREERGFCASLEMCKSLIRNAVEYWVTNKKDPYINIDSQKKLQKIIAVLTATKY